MITSSIVFQREEEELREFELLEMATVGDTPICRTSSSTSLDQAPPTFDIPLSRQLLPTSPSPTGATFEPATGSPLEMHLVEGGVRNYDVDSNLRLVAYKDDRTLPGHTLPPKEVAPELTNNVPWQQPPPLPPEEVCAGRNDDRDNLDDTLTGPSLLGEVDFNDEEEWHSFSQDSPAAGQARDGVDFVDSEEGANGSMVSVEVGASWSSPVRREKLNEQGLPILQSPLPSSTLSGVAMANPEMIRQQSHPLTDRYSTNQEPLSTLASMAQTASRFHPIHQNVNKANSNMAVSAPLGSRGTASSSLSSMESQATNPQQLSSISYQQQLPPPSVLVAKLFPALKKDERPHDLTAVTSKPSSKPVRAQSPHVVDKTPSPTSSAGGDSGKGSLAAGSSATSVMNEELRRKLCQLETEIERFKSENAALERLRKEKEEVSYVCTSCICVIINPRRMRRRVMVVVLCVCVSVCLCVCLLPG